jgi:hypothetical protein
MLAAAGGVFEGVVELLKIHAGGFADISAASFNVRHPPALSDGGK